MTLTPDEKKLIKATVPILQAHGVELTDRFYHRMLDAHTELKSVFRCVRYGLS